MTEKPTVSRRTVAKGIAWTAPAVAVSAAVPAYAASPTPCVTMNFFWQACKGPGQPNLFSYDFAFSFTNGCSSSVTVTVLSVAKKNVPLYVDSGLTNVYDNELTCGPYTLAPGATSALCDPPMLYSSNSAGTIVIRYSINGGTPIEIERTAVPCPKDPAAATEPVTTEPVTTEAAATDPVTTDPAATEAAVTEPAVTEAAVTEPAVTETTVQK